jgi:hypothetical protein
LICSRSPPALRQSFAQVQRRRWAPKFSTPIKGLPFSQSDLRDRTQQPCPIDASGSLPCLDTKPDPDRDSDGPDPAALPFRVAITQRSRATDCPRPRAWPVLSFAMRSRLAATGRRICVFPQGSTGPGPRAVPWSARGSANWGFFCRMLGMLIRFRASSKLRKPFFLASDTSLRAADSRTLTVEGDRVTILRIEGCQGSMSAASSCGGHENRRPAASSRSRERHHGRICLIHAASNTPERFGAPGRWNRSPPALMACHSDPLGQ